MSLAKQILPPGVRAVVDRLQAQIEVAESVQGVNMAAQRAEGFVLGLETSGGYKTDQVETQYIGFEAVAQSRRDALRHA
ncbi:hypothetical protein [Pseudomonas sp. ICMP 561]|uniref:hypothetical protein n=1 Tax=Pseudomonas sp. ICMP 561 TaxID=1718918 RepID=UPI000C07E6C8|nr:hypothetical protein [Pseudomonas sp. ICMP 561]PHN22808.1 hypothetical protein AO242_16145 [Pseudomonas sp. ICMP 561]